jgi:NTP pyrophosphatase (non-canonical NTP hydrolase)
MKGNALTPENRAGIQAARELLSKMKQTKLELRAYKYLNTVADFEALFQKLEEEVTEIKEAWESGSLIETAYEIADASNCLDLLLFETLTLDALGEENTPAPAQAQTVTPNSYS